MSDVRINARRAKLSNRTQSPEFASFVPQKVYYFFSLHQTGTPREITLQKSFQINVPLSGLIDGTIIALVLAKKGNNSIK